VAKSFSKKQPCPICHGWAWNQDKKCRGFMHKSGEGWFCEQPNEGEVIRPLGFALYWYRNPNVLKKNRPDGANRPGGVTKPERRG